ncbi:hypothetical protein KEM52_006071 [Ascosphaera acerosa]|nr:hypothetical protein KEM52_006071 [Ascosphaera acerosa]
MPVPKELLAVSWTLHRLSQLFSAGIAGIENQDGLDELARRMRNHLRGDAFREIYAGLEYPAVGADAIAKAGPLKQCHWKPLPSWSAARDTTDDSSALSGIFITLEHENAVYKAALIGRAGVGVEDGSLKLPLLLTRLPNALRQAVITFICETFDAHCAPLRLPSDCLCRYFEAYVRSLARADEEFVEAILKDAQLSVVFPPPIAPSLKGLQIYLPQATIGQLAQTNDGDSGDLQQPIFTALSDHLTKHLAMDVQAWSPKLGRERIVQVSSAAVVLGSEGKVKLAAQPQDGDGHHTRKDRAIQQANQGLLIALVERAEQCQPLSDLPA